jgi:Tol biopolymer transport system component
LEDLNPAFAPTTKALIIAFIERSSRGARLCFATIGRFALNSDCTAAPGWDLGGQVGWSPDGSTILVLGSRNRGANFGLLAFTSNVPFSTHAADWGHGNLQTNASLAGQGVFAGAFSPDGKRMALVSNIGGSDFHLYVVPAGTFSPTLAQQLPVRACQVSWRSDGQELAVMQPDGLCDPTATGTVVGVDVANPRATTILATQAAHPQWQPVANGG